MSRRPVLVELDQQSAIVSGPRVLVCLNRTGGRWHWHESRRGGVVRVKLDGLDDLVAALEDDGQLVEVVDRRGRPVPVGGLFRRSA